MMRKAYGETCLSESQINRWYKCILEGREDLADEERSGRPRTSTSENQVSTVRDIMLSDRRLTLREISDDAGVSLSSCYRIVSDALRFHRVSAKLVPTELSADQKEVRKEISLNILEDLKEDPGLLHRVITGDETWVYGFDPETKQQASEWRLQGEKRPQRANRPRSRTKVFWTVFFDSEGVIHQEFLPPELDSCNKEYYLSVLKRLREAIRRKRPIRWQRNDWLLHHDNAPPHTALIIKRFLAKHGTVKLPQPPVSPDLAPCDFFLFSKLKRSLKGRRFESVEEIKEESLRALHAIPKQDFQTCIQQWQDRYSKCVAAQGEYFEGDNVNYDE